jgi:Family of unknown function (DUF5906)
MTSTYHDARLLTPFDPEDARYQQEIKISFGPNAEAKTWIPKSMSIAAFIERLAEHREGKKDGPAFVTGEVIGKRRVKAAMKGLYAVGLDIDCGIPSATVDAAMVKRNCLAIRYTTHSHFRDRTELKLDPITKWAKGAEIDDDLIQRYLREEKHWAEEILLSARFVGQDHTERGLMGFVEHAPMAKHRVVFPFAAPFVIADEAKGTTQQAAMDKWSKVPLALAESLGLPIDKTGVDPSRLFFTPRHARNRPWEITITGGALLDWRDLTLEDPLEELAREGARSGGKSKTDAGRELGRDWSRDRAEGFQIVDVLRNECPDKIRRESGAGVNIECPFDDSHSNSGDPEDSACWAVNAGEGQSPVFTVSCRHDSCREFTCLDMLAKMLADKWFGREVLESGDYNPEIDGSESGSGGDSEDSRPDVFDFYEEDKLIEEIDSVCRVIALGGKRRFAVLGPDREPQFLTRADAAVELAQYKLWRNKGTEAEPDWVAKSGFDIWLASSKRQRNFDGAEFNPAGVREGILNLWTGFAVEPAPGDWSLLRAHMWENICQRNEEHFAWLMGWHAQLFQEPGRKSGVAVVLRGDVGVGKTKLFEWIGNIIGDRHALVADKSEQCTGKFNAQLEQNIFVSAEEAFFAGDPAQGRALKHLITGHKLMYEPKGRDAYMGRSYSRLGMTTNDKWAVAAVRRERRYLILDVAPTRQKDGAYFAAIDRQMRNGGAAAMLYDLLRHDYSGIDFQNPPVTDALRDIIQRGIDNSEKWLQSVLEEGRFPVRQDSGREEIEWEEKGCEVAKAEIVASYNDFVPNFKKVPATSQDVFNFFKASKLTGITPSKMSNGMSGRVPSWKFPSLAAARADYANATGYSFESTADDASE